VSIPADSTPLISIITTSYNSASTIADTLHSVACQDYPHIEHIIVDGASKDNTIEIVRSFPHVKKLISEKDKGLYDAMNKGLAASNGTIIGFLNSDDFYVASDIIQHVVNQMKMEGSDALYADLVYVHPQNTNRILRTWHAGKFEKNKFLFGWMPPHPTFFVRKKIYDQHGSFNTELKSAADYELMLRFLYKHKISVTYLPKVIIKMRTGGVSNASLTNRLKANREDRKAWRINQLEPYIFTTVLKPLRKLTQFIFEKNKVL
jgi:glycosyltransferase